MHVSLLYDDIILAIHFSYDSVIILREHLKWSKVICQGHCVYFTTTIVAINHNERSVVGSRKIERYVYLRKTIIVTLF